MSWPGLPAAGEQDRRAHQPVTALGEESLKLADRLVIRHWRPLFAKQARRSRRPRSLSGGRIAPLAAGSVGLRCIKTEDYVSPEHEAIPPPPPPPPKGRTMPKPGSLARILTLTAAFGLAGALLLPVGAGAAAGASQATGPVWTGPSTCMARSTVR